MPNLKTQTALKTDLDRFLAQEEALRVLGWTLFEGAWYRPGYGDPVSFDVAVVQAGLVAK